jgi:hypothetical protein
MKSVDRAEAKQFPTVPATKTSPFALQPTIAALQFHQRRTGLTCTEGSFLDLAKPSGSLEKAGVPAAVVVTAAVAALPKDSKLLILLLAKPRRFLLSKSKLWRKSNESDMHL